MDSKETSNSESTKGSTRLGTIHLQYQVAVNLYTHEDDLNWRKLNNLFYVTAGLMAAGGFVLDLKDAHLLPRLLLLLLLSLIGMISSRGFKVALESGVQYLHERKEDASKIERILQNDFGGIHIITLEPGREVESHFKRAPTAEVLKRTPVLIFRMWSVLSAVLLAGLLLSALSLL